MNRLLLSFALLSGTLLLAACSQPAATTEPASPASTSAVVKGYGISPQGFPADYSRYADFLTEVGQLPNGGVMFNGAWRQDVAGGSDAGEIPAPAAGLLQAAAQYGYTPIVVFGWRSSETELHIGVPANPANDWGNMEARALFKQMLVDFATQYQPPYLFLGNESDAYYIANPADYERWVEFYSEAYDAIKAASPDTQVGPILQYERTAGLGSFSGWTEPHWGALEAHDLSKVDILGITLYPFFSVASPEDIPSEYLAPLAERIGTKAVAITETGWPAENLGLNAPWEESPEAQVRYLEALDNILSPLKIRVLNWLFVYPIDSGQDSFDSQAFGSISLRDANGDKRPIYDAWINYLPRAH
jgi:hypothetical protein